MLQNETYFNGGMNLEAKENTPIAVSPYVSDQYDYSVTDDGERRRGRKDTGGRVYEG